MIMTLKVILFITNRKILTPHFVSDCFFPIHFSHMISCFLVMFGSWGVISEDPGYWSFSEKGEEGVRGRTNYVGSQSSAWWGVVSDRVYGKEKSLNFRYLEVEICENALACWDELFIYHVIQ